MKNKISALFIVLLIVTLSVFVVSADDTSAIPEIRQEFPQKTKGEMQQGEFTPGQRPQGGRGQMSAQESSGETVTEQKEQSSPVQENGTTEKNKTSEEQSPSGEQNQMLEMDMEGNMPQRGGFNPMEQSGFSSGRETQTEEEAEKPYEKWMTSIVSAVLLIFGLVFVALYKRKEY